MTSLHVSHTAKDGHLIVSVSKNGRAVNPKVAEAEASRLWPGVAWERQARFSHRTAVYSKPMDTKAP